MKATRWLLIAVLTSPCLTRGALGDERVDYSGHKLVRVQVNTPDELAQLRQISPDIWNCNLRLGPVDARIPPDRVDALVASDLAYEVVSDDIGPAMDRHLSRSALRGDFDDYKTYDEIMAFIEGLVATRPDLCDISTIGFSIEGRPIRVLRVSGPGAGSKPAVFYHGLQHAREWITGSMVLFLAEHLVTRYDTDPCIQDLVNHTEFFLAPCVNPDGYSYTWESDRLWRKNRRDNGSGIFGVDLNRNWAFGWSGPGADPDPDDNLYYGTAPFSEPETTALSNFIIDHPNIAAYMDYHSYSQLILWPYGHECVDAPEPDRTAFYMLGDEMQQLILEVHGKYYERGPICETLYQASGASVDWVYDDQGVFAFTIELRPETSLPGFELPPDEIVPTCEENLPAILALSEWASSAVFIRAAEDLPDAVAAGQVTTVDIMISDAQDTYLANSAAVHYRYSKGAPFKSEPLMPLGGDLHRATIPPGPCNALLQYYFTASSQNSMTASLPCAAPANRFTAHVTGFDVAFEDHLETDTGWTTENLGATSGDWQRGIPIDDPDWPYDPASDSDGSGQCWLTENLNNPSYGDPHNTDVDDGAVRLISGLLDMSSGDVTVSYDYFLRLSNTDGSDMLLVEIADEAGAGLWTEIARHDTNGGLDWRHHDISQAALDAAGVATSDAMRLRFTVNDADPQSVVEGGIDHLLVVDVGCTALAGDADGDGDRDLDDLAAFADCMGGVSALPAPTCPVPSSVFDFDGDRDIDVRDFASLQELFLP